MDDYERTWHKHIRANFSEGLTFIDGLGTFIDKNGRMPTKMRFHYAGEFSEGLAPVLVSVDENGSLKNLWGYIDKGGDFVIKPQFLFALEFSEGLAAVEFYDPDKQETIWGYIDKSGSIKVKVNFISGITSYPGYFSEGLAFVCEDVRRDDGVIARENECSYINNKGEKIVSLGNVHSGSEFNSGIAFIVTGGAFNAYIDNIGYIIGKVSN